MNMRTHIDSQINWDYRGVASRELRTV